MNQGGKGLVIDCSFIMSVLLPDEMSDHSQEVLSSGHWAPWVPALWVIEVSNVLLTVVRRKRISKEVQNLLIENIAAIGVKVDNALPDQGRIITLATEFGLTANDAMYLDLALRRGFPLATLDDELKRAAQGAGVAVI